MTRYDLWVRLGRPDGVFSVWSTRMNNAYVAAFAPGMEYLDREAFMRRERESGAVLRWILRTSRGPEEPAA